MDQPVYNNRYILLDETTTLINQVIYQGYVSSFGISLGGLPWVIMSEVFVHFSVKLKKKEDKFFHMKFHN